MIEMLDRRFRSAFASSGLFSLLIIIVATACNSDQAIDSDPVIDLRTEVYGSHASSEALQDTRLRSSRPTQTQGTISTLRIGREFTGEFDMLILDSGVVYNDSIPAGAQALACTLWIQVSQQPHVDGDSLVIDLWSVSQSWIENQANWSQRKSGVDWSIAGGFGELITEKLIVAQRIDGNNFTWRVNGELVAPFDTVTQYPALFLPIPIDTSLAQRNIDGLSYGFALRTNSESGVAVSFSFISSESMIVENRPYLVWVYNLPVQ